VDVSNRGSSIEKDRTRCVGVAWVTKHDRFSIPAGVGSRLTPGARYSGAALRDMICGHPPAAGCCLFGEAMFIYISDASKATSISSGIQLR
jgi:hypothetical protein